MAHLKKAHEEDLLKGWTSLLLLEVVPKLRVQF